jgi:uncharacterized protein
MTRRGSAAPRRDGAFDAFGLAAREQEIAGKVDASSLPRVADRLAPGTAPIQWHIAGMTDASGRPALEVRLDGEVQLECQRCLRPFTWPVAQSTVVLLARDERELAQLDADDAHEVILAAAPIAALTLVEDELVLTLPFAPHCDRADCAMGDAAHDGGEGAEQRTARSPFSELAALKGHSAGKPKD